MRHFIENAPAAHTVPSTQPAHIENVSRRAFLAGASGLVVALQFAPLRPAKAYETYAHGGQTMSNGIVSDPHVFVSIDPDGTVTIVAHRSEMGTGSRTSIPMVIAEELDADWNQVRIVQAEGDEKKYGNQDTDGSRSLRHHIQPARDIGASVRRMLEQTAAAHWKVPVGEVHAENHSVIHRATGRRLGYGDLASEAMNLPVPERATLSFKKESDFRYLGKGEIPITDLHDITTGEAVYGADVTLPGMKYAVVARPPVVGGTIKSVDRTAALAVQGVERVETIPGSPLGSKFKPLGGIAVIASNTWAALKGRSALKIEWESGEHGSYDSDAYEKELRQAVAAPGTAVRSRGDVDDALGKAARVVSREYYQKHMVHVPMEPPAALASVANGKCEVWGCLQSPYGARLDIADFLGMKEEDVRVNVTLLGGGFGRKSKCDFALEAAYLSKQVGAPVRVQWTREDDVRHSFHHTTSVERIEVGLDAENKPVAWRHRSAAPSFLSTFVPDEGKPHPIEIGMGLEDFPYDVANSQGEYCKAYAHTRIGWYRAVSHIPRAFAIQSMTAELAAELGRDQKDFLLEMIGPPRILDHKQEGVKEPYWNHGEPYDEFPYDTGRLSNVVKLVADKAGWGRTLPAGEGLGIAVHRSFVSYIATVVHAKVGKDGSLEVPEAHVAIDCGYVANPERVRSQVEGACVFGMSAALYSAVTYKNGAVVQSNFHDYPLARANGFPLNVHVHIVPHPFEVHATGVGEPAVPPFLPALTNAIFNASGKRIRNLPIEKQLMA